MASVHSPNQFSSHATRLKLKKEHLEDAESNIESSGLVAKNRTEVPQSLFITLLFRECFDGLLYFCSVIQLTEYFLSSQPSNLLVHKRYMRF